MNRKRLRKFRDFLRTVVPPKQFDIGVVVKFDEDKVENLTPALAAGKECGFAGCALGWAPVCFPKLLGYYGDEVVFKDDGKHFMGSAIFEELFDIDPRAAEAIYSPHMYTQVHVTPRVVANRIDEILDGAWEDEQS
jgi:hypothetical protein